jgi:nucleotidyltransferase-like protein
MNSSNSAQPSSKILLTHFRWTVDRFEEILKNEKTDYYRDAALQRFTFTYDITLKYIRSLATEQGTPCESFQQCFQWAIEKQWVAEDAPWKEMETSFNRATQKLKGEQADREYEKLGSYCLLMKHLCEKLTRITDKY